MAKTASSPVQRDPANPSKKGSPSAWFNPTRWLELIADVVTRSMSKAPREHVVLIVSEFIGAAIGFLVSVFLIYKGAYILGGILCIVILLFCFGIWCIFFRNLKPKPDSVNPTARWSRWVVKVPIKQEALEELTRKLQTVRDLAEKEYYDSLGRQMPPTGQSDSDRVRVNIFLPDTQNVVYGEPCSLIIPEGLHCGMKNPNERHIRFRPGQGVTGKVFTLQQPIGTFRKKETQDWEWVYLEGKSRIGDEGFELTQRQMHLIDKNLRWIVSFPLKVGVNGDRHTAGVLNVDGLSQVLNPKQMQTIYLTLKPQVEDIEKCLGELGLCKISIAVEDTKAAVATS